MYLLILFLLLCLSAGNSRCWLKSEIWVQPILLFLLQMRCILIHPPALILFCIRLSSMCVYKHAWASSFTFWKAHSTFRIKQFYFVRKSIKVPSHITNWKIILGNKEYSLFLHIYINYMQSIRLIILDIYYHYNSFFLISSKCYQETI